MHGARHPQIAVKRCILALYDAAALLTVAATCSLALIEDAFAYVDPSVMTYAIQALAGVAVAIGAVAGVAFRRTRRSLLRLLGIDENAGKSAEGAARRIDELDEEARAEAEKQACRLATSLRGSKRAPLPWKKRIAFALIASGFLVFTLFVASPYELIGGGSASLLFGLSETWKPVAVAGTIVWLVLALSASLLRGKAFDAAVVALIGFGLLCYLQVLFGNGNLPSADGAAIAWGDYLSTMVLNGILWLTGIAGIVLLFRKRPVICRNAFAILAVCVALIEAVGVGSLFADPVIMGKVADDTEPYVTEDGLFDVSGSHNVILFLLDWYDNEALNTLFDADPSILGEMTGFTYYRNTVGTIAPTGYAVPWILTAQFVQHDETFPHYLDTIYERSSFLDDLEATGYSIGIYTDTFGATNEEAARGRAYSAQRAFNIHPVDSVDLLSVNEIPTVLVMYKASCYRNLPWVAKPLFWFYTDEINNAMTRRDRPGEDLADALYIMDDARYCEKLRKGGLGLNDDEVGSFRLIHLMGIHEPYTLAADGTRAADGSTSTRMEQAKGVMEIVSEYLKQLKDLGVYNRTTIIISCDHGTYRWEEDPLHTPNSPVILVKPAGSGEQDAPIALSDAPVSQFDLHASIMKAITGDGSAYGIAFDEVDEDAIRTRTYVHPTAEVPFNAEFIEYQIDGYALDFDNWHTTGKIWDFKR